MLLLNEVERMRDPFVLLNDGVYYLYGSGGICYKNSTGQISSGWEKIGSVIQKPDTAVGDYFWAPEVYRYDDAFYMFTSYRSSVTGGHGCVVFRSTSPEGPFIEASNGTITPPELWCIDGSLYKDKENQPWMIYSEEYVRAADGIGNMFAAKMSADLTRFTAEPILLFRGDAPEWSSGKITEGPYIYRCKSGELLMLVSGFQKVGEEYRYCVGISRSDNGEIDGKWSHDSSLLYSKALSGKYDGGHGMIFTSLTGQMYLSIHSPNHIEGVNCKPVFVPIKEVDSTLVWDTK